jgi:hypothetical protein
MSAKIRHMIVALCMSGLWIPPATPAEVKVDIGLADLVKEIKTTVKEAWNYAFANNLPDKKESVGNFLLEINKLVVAKNSFAKQLNDLANLPIPRPEKRQSYRAEKARIAAALARNSKQMHDALAALYANIHNIDPQWATPRQGAFRLLLEIHEAKTHRSERANTLVADIQRLGYGRSFDADEIRQIAQSFSQEAEKLKKELEGLCREVPACADGTRGG